MEVEGQVAVIPEAGAEQHFLEPGAQVFIPRPHQGAAQQHPHSAPALEPPEAQSKQYRPKPPHQRKGAEQDAAAVLELAPGEKHERRLDVGPQEGGNEEDPEEPAQAHPLSRAVCRAYGLRRPAPVLRQRFHRYPSHRVGVILSPPSVNGIKNPLNFSYIFSAARPFRHA